MDNKEAKYINDPEMCNKTAEEFVQEFKDFIYPAYASYGLTLFEAIQLWKLNVISNSLVDIKELLDNKGYES